MECSITAHSANTSRRSKTKSTNQSDACFRTTKKEVTRLLWTEEQFLYNTVRIVDPAFNVLFICQRCYKFRGTLRI